MSLALGPVFPLYGIMEGADGALRCECGRAKCRTPGKHPRFSGWQTHATDDPAQVRDWHENWPHANFGIMTGIRVVAVDLDIRPGKNGVAELSQLEFDVGQRVPYTVTVDTGRGNGSQHLYFRVPPNALGNGTHRIPGVDVRGDGGYCVAPGSRHIYGGFYRFAEELRPDEIDLADIPDFLLEAVSPMPSRMPVAGAQKPYNAALDLSGITGPFPPLPDYQVLGILKRDAVARTYWEGRRWNRHNSPSEDDFALACKLAFYCRHNLDQMYRLFLQSRLVRRKWFENRPAGNYALQTLIAAVNATPNVWTPKKRVRKSRATGAKKGRKLDPVTIFILALHDVDPDRNVSSIADELGITAARVRDAIRYHRPVVSAGSNTENAVPLLHGFSSKGTIQGPVALRTSHMVPRGYRVQDDEDKGNTMDSEGTSTTTEHKGFWLSKYLQISVDGSHMVENIISRMSILEAPT